jgi:hypothetical protein
MLRIQIIAIELLVGLEHSVQEWKLLIKEVSFSDGFT